MKLDFLKLIIILVFLILPNLLRTFVTAVALNLSNRNMKLSTWLEKSLKRVKRDDEDDSDSSEERPNVNYFHLPGPSGSRPTPTLDTRALLWGIIFSSLTGRGASHGKSAGGGGGGGTAGGGTKDEPEGENPVIAPPPEPGLFGGFGGFPFDIGDLFADEDTNSQFPKTAAVDVPPPPASSRGSRGPAQPRNPRP